MARNVGNVNHANIHANVTHVVSFVSVYQAVTTAIAQVAVQPVGIADGDSCNARITVDRRFARLAYAVALRHLAD